jgi:DNA-binding response OmpR family regulator
MAKKGIILVIEDDPAIREGVVDALDFDGYEVLQAGRGKAGMKMALRSTCDLVLLDLVLPEIHGLEILKELRKGRPTLPVIIMTAKGAEADRIKGLKLGADDYVVKPFSVKELLARVEAVLRRSADRPLDIRQISLPHGRVDLDRCEICFENGDRVEISQKEIDLLRYLAARPNRAVSREEIMERVWRLNLRSFVETRTIDMHIARLRDKLRDDGSDPQVIRTIRGKGYMFVSVEQEP